MDELSAHLDRGWDLVQRGDAAGAETSARRALELDKESPEAYNLLGFVAASRGEYEDAIDHYRQSIALDDSYFEAMLNAAEIYIHPLGDFDEAIRMCDVALDLAETDDEVVDALLLKFDALLGTNRIDEARALCARFPEGPLENPNHAFLVGRAFYEIGDGERAAPLVESAVKSTPNNPEAYYYLGLVRDERGETPGATEAFMKSRELDVALPPLSWSLTREAFMMTVWRAIERLDPGIRAFLREKEVYVSDAPGVELVADGVDPRALLLLDGIAPPEGGEPRGARLFVYQRNVERLAGALEMVEDDVFAALDREIRAAFVDTSNTDRELLN